MPEDDAIKKVATADDTAGKNYFDELAKGLASGSITRLQALKLLGAAIASAMLGPLPSKRAFAQDSNGGCPLAHDPCGSTCCSPADKCCDPTAGLCCGAAEECCAGTCCEAQKTCVDGQCVCASSLTPCGDNCCDPLVETCGEDGQCHNEYCESCRASGGNCCQDVSSGYLSGQACCTPGESMCMVGGQGCLCCPSGTRCPDATAGEGFACVSLE